MLLAAYEPGKEMAFANFFLAIFCLFTVALPLILITRGDKTEANRDFLVSTINPWHHAFKETEAGEVVLTEITTSAKIDSNMATSDQEPLTEIDNIISLEIKGNDELNESSIQLPVSDDELLAA